jgi:hypothetical protein
MAVRLAPADQDDDHDRDGDQDAQNEAGDEPLPEGLVCAAREGADAPLTTSRLLPIAAELLAFTLDTICSGNDVTMDVLMTTPLLWTSFLQFQAQLTSHEMVFAQPTECGEFRETSSALASIARLARRAIAAGSVLSLVPMGTLRLYKTHLRHLGPLFAAGGSSLATAGLNQALKQVSAARMQLRTVTHVALELLATYDSEILRCCMVLEGGWESNTIKDAEAFLGIKCEETQLELPQPLRLKSKGGRQHKLRPLPKMLVAALHWLRVVCYTRLFHRFWAEAASNARAAADELDEDATGGEPLAPPLPHPQSSVDHEDAALVEEEWLCRAVLTVRRAWMDAYDGLRTMSTRLDELREFVDVLLRPRELHALESTAAGLLRLSDDGAAALAALEAAAAWPLEEPDPEWQQEAGDQLSRLAHVCAVRAVLPRIRRCLVLLEAWVEPATNEPLSLANVQAAAVELDAVLAARWEAATLATLDVFDRPACKVDARLLVFEDSLFDAVQQSTELVQWYRITPDEQNFTTSVEMAMGRSQMECPDALWNHVERCVDEGKLSMLSSVRAYLHEHLFGSGDGDIRLTSIHLTPTAESAIAPREQYTYAVLLDVFSRLDWQQAVGIANALHVCGPLVGAFVGLMGSKADSAAPHRLASLQGRQMRARFWCSSGPPMAPASRQVSADEQATTEPAATEVTTTATDDGMMLAPARTASHATSATNASHEGLPDRQAHTWLEYSVVRHGRRATHVLPLSE